MRDELERRYFTCKRCGAHGEVAFGVEGTSGWVRQRRGLLERADALAARQAEDDLRTDAMRTQQLIPCPSCGRRAPGATRWVGIRIGFWVACGAGLAIVGASGALLGALGCGGLATWQAWRELGRLRRADRAMILKLDGGTPPHALEPPEPSRPIVHRQLAPPPDLPQARVVSAPALIAEPDPDPTAPPRFLNDADKNR